MNALARWASAAPVCLGALGPSVARGDPNPGTTAAIVAGTTAASASSSRTPAPTYGRLAGRPLSDWVNPVTGSPSVLGAGCGIAVEVALSGTNQTNYVNISVANLTDRPIAFWPNETTMRFSNGLVRRPLPTGALGVSLEPEWMVRGGIAFPEKAEFEGQEWILLQIVTSAPGGGERCTIPVLVERDRTKQPDAASYVARSVLEVQLSAGSGFAATGSLGSVIEPKGVTIDVGFGYYPWVHHGFTLDLVVSRHGTAGVSHVVPLRPPDGLELGGAGFFAGYSGRIYALPWLSIAWQPSIGPYVLSLSESRSNGETIMERGVFAVHNRLRLSARFATMSDGTEFSLAAAAVQLWVPHGHIGDASLSGNAFTGLLSFVVGE
jgi:hypothetical protein